MLVWTVPVDSDSRGMMCLAWKISITNGREVNKKGAFLKISFISVLKTFTLAPLQIPASLCEGTIYLLFC